MGVKDRSEYTTLYPVMRTMYLSKKELEKLPREAYVRFYFGDFRSLKIAKDAGFKPGKNALKPTVSALFQHIKEQVLLVRTAPGSIPQTHRTTTGSSRSEDGPSTARLASRHRRDRRIPEERREAFPGRRRRSIVEGSREPLEPRAPLPAQNRSLEVPGSTQGCNRDAETTAPDWSGVFSTTYDSPDRYIHPGATGLPRTRSQGGRSWVRHRALPYHSTVAHGECPPNSEGVPPPSRNRFGAAVVPLTPRERPGKLASDNGGSGCSSTSRSRIVRLPMSSRTRSLPTNRPTIPTRWNA